MKASFSIMKKAPIRVSLWAIFLGLAFFLFLNNARYSEEFTGWVKISIAGQLDQDSVKNDILAYMENKWYKDSNIAIELDGNISKISLRSQIVKDEQVNELSQNIQSLLIKKWYIQSTNDVVEQSITGPSVWSYMQKSAKNALIVGLVLMAIYMLFSFAGIRKEISPVLLAGVVVVTMVFDVMIPAWAYGIWMSLDKTIAIDTIFIIAVLTNMGYSINDTIIVFDRIRENMKNNAGKKVLFGEIFEKSIRQTMRRSFGTVFTTFLVILAMYLLWTWVIKQFSFTIGIWVIAGSFSSIFISVPLTYILLGKYKKERKEMSAKK